MASKNVVSIAEAASAPQVQQAICDEHGPFEQKVTQIMSKVFTSHCPACDSARKSQESAERKARDAWERRINLDHRLGSAAIPKRFADKSFAQYRAESKGQKRALAACVEFAENFDKHFGAGRCLMMLGTPGTGKTHLAAAIANRVINHHSVTAVYRTIGSVFHAIRDSYSIPGEKSEGQIIDSLIAADLLVLDEVGVSKEQPSDFELRTTFAIINGRYEQQKPTVIISNLGVDEVKVALGDRSADRLREGGVIVLLFSWPSARGEVGGSDA